MNPETTTPNSFGSDLAEIRGALQIFLRHPVREIRRLPNWEWRRILIAQILFGVLTGFLSGVVHHSLYAVFFSTIETPVLSIILTYVSTLFFFFVFQIVQHIFVEFRQLYTSIFFANIPLLIFQMVGDFFPPILLVGLGFSALLLIVAFVANFRIPRPFATRLISVIYVMLVIVNLLAWWSSHKYTETWHGPAASEHAAPEVKLGN